MLNQQIQNYKVISLLGEGGMAKVFLAHDAKFDTNVAIKLLNKEFTHNENIRKRFLAEARSMYRMSHPNIIKVTDLIDENETVAFVMEYVEGDTLKDFIDRKGRLLDEEIKDVFSQMLDSLGYVHEQNLVHRDIKPSNFMVTPSGVVKLMDFGIAKNTDVNSAEYTQTGTGVQMGTPMYMSPEQITETKSVTPQSDIYSLGVVLWQLVTGEKPYDMKTLTNFQLQMKIVQEELPLTNTNWDTFIQKATSKNNENRFSSCKEFSLKLNSDNNTLQVNDVDKTILNSVQNSEKTIIEQKVEPEVLLEGSILNSEGNLKYGLINLKGEWVIQPMFDEALYLDEQGFSRATINDKYGIIDRKGNWTIQPMFEFLSSFDEQGFSVAGLNGKYGMINRTGNWIIQPMFESIFGFDESGFARVKLNDKWGGINQKGDWIIQPMFNYLRDFDKEDFAEAEINEKSGFIDRKGNWIIQPIFDNVSEFDDHNYSEVQLNDKHGFIDRKGNWIIQPIFDIAYGFDKFGYSIVQLNNKFGFIERQGNWIIQPIFDDVDRFDELGLARVKLNDKWGFIDKKGNWIIQPMFEIVMNFYDQVYAPATSNEKWGFIDRKGNWSINPRFDYAHNFDHGFAIIQENSKTGIIDINGNWAIQPEYMVYQTKNNLWKVSDGKHKYGYKNLKNDWVIQPIFDYIFDEDDFEDDFDDLLLDEDSENTILEKKNKIINLYKDLVGKHKVYLQNEIPVRKLSNFIQSYSDEFINESELLVYYDDTLFGKGDDGFLILLNNQKFYLFYNNYSPNFKMGMCLENDNTNYSIKRFKILDGGIYLDVIDKNEEKFEVTIAMNSSELLKALSGFIGLFH